MLFSWTLSLIFIFLSHPLSLGFILLLQTIVTSLMLGNLNLNFWFSYILFLIMISGMLVLFIYMTSIASNEMFKFSKNSLIFMMIFMTMLILTIQMDNYFSLMELMNENILKFNTSETNLSMNKFTNNPNWSIFFMLILYLLITLIAIVKIAYMKFGTLRPSYK
uniref:NADH-ubiquinone oxidoreductase chain 6 n=1 Tax=Entiminae sp. ACP-2013 TaxID=2480628 RepID=A0A3G5FP04_9CUCU|nr:NADH dehydrogenase subunit 6 [Entiminae sp. ACP-2013]